MTASDIVPDTKDWTWVLDAPCPECGFVADAVQLDRVGTEIRRNAEVWTAVLDTRGADVRPAPQVWSPAEYACHVRDVHRVFTERVRLMLDQDGPTFAGWDQDQASLDDHYAEQPPADVGVELAEAASVVADLYDTLPAESLPRTARRGDGSDFTVESLVRYHLHDVVHHLWDVRRAVTVAAYDAAAPAYRDASSAMGDQVRGALRAFVTALGRDGRVLEIGSGGGRDALALEEAGLRVRRTDVASGFVDLLRAEGHRADVLDPLTDDLADPEHPEPYDGVWANASLLHVARTDLALALGRLAAVTRPGGLLHLALKEGDGEGWSTHGAVALPRMFTYWHAAPLSEAVTDAGWLVDRAESTQGRRGERWLTVAARRGGPA